MTLLHAVQGFALGRLAGVLQGIGRPAEPAPRPPNAAQPDQRASDRAPVQQVEVRPPDPTPLEIAERIITPVLSPLSTAAIVFIFSVFILLQQDDLRDRLIRLLGSGDLHRTTSAFDDAGHRLSRYFLAQLGVNAAFGCVIAAGLYFVGVPSPLLWGILGGLLRFVPYVGAFLAAGLPLALAGGVTEGWTMMAWTAGLFVMVEGLTGQVVEPRFYGRSTGLSPFAVRGRGDVLDLAVGPDRPHPLHPAHPLPRRHGPLRAAARVPRRAPGRPPGPHPGRELLSAHARQRPRRGAGPGRSAGTCSRSARPPAGTSAVSTCRGWPWSASATSTSAAARPTSATSCSASVPTTTPPRSATPWKPA